MIRLKFKTDNPMFQSVQAQEWLAKVEQEMNKSELLRKFTSDMVIFGSSTITAEMIVEEIRERTK